MDFNIAELPEDVTTLKGIVHGAADEIRRIEKENNLLREQVQLLRSQLYGRKSEKLNSPDGAEQQLLFDEVAELEAEQDSEPKTKEIKAHTRTYTGRKPLPADLPRIEVIHDITPEEKMCDCGCDKIRIGEEVCEKLDIIPARVQVIRHIRPKYACKGCESVESEGPTVAIAPVPEQIIPKCIATPGLLAYILTAKFVDALPFYRQEQIFARLGIDLSRTLMSTWAIRVSILIKPLLELLHAQILSGPLIQADETTVQVMKEPGRADTSKSYMWVFRGGPPDKPAVIYHYEPTRSGEVAKKFIKEFKGCVQTDGYAGYDFLDKLEDVIHAGCWAHARRKYMEAIKGGAKNKSGSADVAVSYIQKLYAIEHDINTRELTGEAVVAERRLRAKPVLDKFKQWLDGRVIKTPPKGLLGKAMLYTLGQWDRLTCYIDNAYLTPDNNLAENAIRPFVVGRKNWLFSGNPDGAQASAALYSLIETAKACDLEPYRYLRHLFERLPRASSPEDYKLLLPQKLSMDTLDPIY